MRDRLTDSRRSFAASAQIKPRWPGFAASAVFLSAYNEKSRRFPATTFLIQSFGLAAVVMLILDFDNVNKGLILIDAWIMTSTVAEMDRISADK